MKFGEFVKQAQALLASEPELANLPVAIEQYGEAAAREADGILYRPADFDPIVEVGHVLDERTSPDYVLITGWRLS